ALNYTGKTEGGVSALEETKRWAHALKTTLELHPFRGPKDMDSTFEAIARRRPDALMPTADPLIASYRARIVAFANQHRLVSMFPGQEYVDAGGLMFYGGGHAHEYPAGRRPPGRAPPGAHTLPPHPREAAAGEPRTHIPPA